MNIHRDIRDLQSQANRIEHNQRKAQELRNEQQRAARAARDQARADQRNTVAGGLAFTGSALLTTWLLDRRERKAHQEELRRQEQDRQYQHWLASTPEGQSYWQWRHQALALEESFEERDQRWQHAWSEAVPHAASHVQPAERQRFERNRKQVKGSGLRVWAMIAFALAAVNVLFTLFQALATKALDARHNEKVALWQDCVREMEAGNPLFYESLCDEVNPGSGWQNVIGASVWVLLFLAAGIFLLIIRRARMRAAKNDQAVLRDVQARTAHFGYDPLAVPAGWVPFRWWADPAFGQHRHEVQHLAWNGSSQRPQPNQLIPLVLPTVISTDQRLPQSINALLTEYSQ